MNFWKFETEVKKFMLDWKHGLKDGVYAEFSQKCGTVSQIHSQNTAPCWELHTSLCSRKQICRYVLI